MKQIFIVLLILFFFPSIPMNGGEPYCNIHHYDESSGLSQRSVKKIVNDTTGMIWIATWNGLNRFDGHEFSVVRPGAGESARRYSSRFRDLQAMHDGSVWCRIDDRIVRLDPSTNRFTDIHTQLEKKLGRQLDFSEWMVETGNHKLVMKCKDIYITLDAAGNLVDTSFERPKLSYTSQNNRSIGDYPGYPFEEQAYGKEDPEGRIWIVSRSGEVAYSPRKGEPAKVIADMKVTDGRLRYSTTDTQGGVWFCSNHGVYRVEMGIRPYENLGGDNTGRILSACYDKDGRLWVAEPDRSALAIYEDSLTGTPKYLSDNGMMSTRFVSFGRRVYSLMVSPDSGRIWVGCKPDGLFTLSPKDEGYEVAKIMDGNIYDLAFDKLGRLWSATNGSGLSRIDDPEAAHPKAVRLSGLPDEASGVRRITVISDTLMLVSTTGGLLAMNPITGESILHVTEVDRLSSLGCIAVTDALVGGDGNIYVSTESGGVSRMSGNPMKEAVFTPLRAARSGIMDVAFAMQRWGDCGMLTVNPGQLTLTSPSCDDSDSITVYGEGFWQSPVRFTEMKPFDLGSGRLLLGTNSGGIVTALEAKNSISPKVIFTSASIQGRRDTVLTPATTEIVLDRHERSLTLRFSALDYANPSAIRYSVRVNGGEWTTPSSSPSISLYDLEPEEYEVEVRATDHFGRFSGSPGRLVIRVTPKWHETTLARIGFWLLGLIILIGIWMVWHYIRSIKHRQHEILTAYLNLMEQNEAKSSGVREERMENTEEVKTPDVSDSDKAFMQRVIDYVQAHISDPDTDVDDMAASIGVSRSGLARKMKNLMGVSPADFLRQSRLKRACFLLSTSDKLVKEIAFDCGFADLNYFGKCFKSAYGKTPTEWRRVGH